METISNFDEEDWIDTTNNQVNMTTDSLVLSDHDSSKNLADLLPELVMIPGTDPVEYNIK